MELEIFRCSTCGNVVVIIHPSGMPVWCCGKKMERMEINTEEMKFESHVPKVMVDGNTIRVMVGEILHPMLEEHHIEWIMITTDRGMYFKKLKTTDLPKAVFEITDEEKLEHAYALCNLHGLWRDE